jgi:hypothetical protein
MNAASYPPPLDQLFSFSDSPDLFLEDWPDYPNQLGLSDDHIPDLIRIATSWDVNTKYEHGDLSFWAPVHAWRSLGQMKATAAIEPLLALFQNADHHDEWVSEELPDIYGLLGPAAIPALANYLADPTQGIWARITANDCIQKIGSQNPESRDRCVEVLTQQLTAFADNDPQLNGLVVCSLLDLNAVEAAAVMEQAFAANAVELDLAGDWEDVQISLGLKTERDTPPPNYAQMSMFADTSASSPGQSQPTRGGGGSKNKIRSKNKMAKQSRKKNRKKKK